MMSHSTPDTPGARTLGWSVRAAWLVPGALATMFLAILGGLLWLMQDRALQRDRADLTGSVHTAQESIHKRLGASCDYLTMLAEDLARDPASAGLCRKRLSQYMADHPELVSVTYVDAGETARWTVPDEAASETVGLPPACPQSRLGYQSARRTGEPAYSRPHTSLQGEPAFDVNVPVVRGEEFGGTFAGVFSCERVLRHILQREILQEHQACLIDPSGRVIAGLPAASQVDERLV